MGEYKTFNLAPIDGGLNEGAAAEEILDSEMVELENWFPFDGRLVEREGMGQIGSIAMTVGALRTTITGLFAFKTATGNWTLLMGHSFGFARLNGSTVEAIPFSVTGTIISDNRADTWSMKQYKDVCYAARPTAGSLWRLTRDFAQTAGIPASGSAPTLADAGAGSLDAGTYYGVVTGLNTNTGVESNPSVVSAAVTIGASRGIAWSNIPTFTTPQVNARNLYRTLVNQTGEYFLVTTLLDNFTTTYTDNVTTAGLGVQASFDNGVPPSNLEKIEIHGERLWATDGEDLFASEDGLAECFSEDLDLPVTPQDGHRILDLHSFGDRLMVGKTNEIAYVLGTDRSNFSVKVLSDRHGVGSRNSFCSAEGVLYWFGADGGIYKSNGSTVEALDTSKVRASLEAINSDARSAVYVAAYPRRSWILFSIPDPIDEFTSVTGVDTSQTNNKKVLVYNYRSNTWSIFTHQLVDTDPFYVPGSLGQLFEGVTHDAPSVIGDFFTSTGEHVLYCSRYDGRVFQYDDEGAGGFDGDTGNPVTSRVETKAFSFGTPGLKKGFRRVGLLTPTNTEAVTLQAFRNNDIINPVASRVVTLDSTDALQMFNLSSLGSMGQTLRLRISHGSVVGGSRLKLAGMSFDVVTLQRVGRAR